MAQMLPGLKMFGVANDYREKIVEVMGDAARELPHDLHLLRLLKLLFGLLAPGQIVNDPDEDGLAVLPGFADREIHREGRSILAEADDLPTDSDDLAFAGSQEVFLRSYRGANYRFAASAA